MNSRTICWVSLGVLTAVVAGCGMPSAAPVTPPKTTGEVLDPCAGRLHDIEGRLLEYQLAHHRLPEELSQINSAQFGSPLPLVCPVSGRQYVYDPQGLALPNRVGVLIVYDSLPVHSAHRWAILAQMPGPGRPMIMRVIAVSNAELENSFRPEPPPTPPPDDSGQN